MMKMQKFWRCVLVHACTNILRYLCYKKLGHLLNSCFGWIKSPRLQVNWAPYSDPIEFLWDLWTEPKLHWCCYPWNKRSATDLGCAGRTSKLLVLILVLSSKIATSKLLLLAVRLCLVQACGFLNFSKIAVTKLLNCFKISASKLLRSGWYSVSRCFC